MTPLGLTTAQALGTLRDQLSSLVEQHQKLSQRRSTIQVIHARATIFCVIMYTICGDGFSYI